MALPPSAYLFGGPHPWSSDDWTSSDDRVRGGSSYSVLNCSTSSNIAQFQGNLDIHTLGGAGFASQRTTGDERTWDLSRYIGLELDTTQGDDKQYTLTIKNDIPPKRPDGRDESSLSWEADFRVSGDQKLVLEWEYFRATYRGKEVKDAEPLDLSRIKRISIMIRSFFGTQEGDFSLGLVSIAGVPADENKTLDKGVVVTVNDDTSHSRREASPGCCIVS